MLRTFLLASCAGLAALARAEVVVLDSGNFEHLTQATTGATTGDWMVKFYAPWCGHCKRMAPAWDSFAEAMEESYVNVAKVDATANRDLAKRFGIKGFPTIKFFKQGKMYSYKGKRDVESFTAFVEGGYLTAEAVDAPSAMSFMDKITSRLGQIADNVQPLLKGENSTVFIFGIVLGVFLTSFVFVMLTPSPSPTRRSKPSSRTAAATEDDDGDDVDGHPKSS